MNLPRANIDGTNIGGITDEQYARLPKFAQHLISRLVQERDVAIRDADMALLATKPAESDTLLDPTISDMIGLGVEGRITYLLDGPVPEPNCIVPNAVRARVVRRQRYGMSKNSVQPYLEVSCSSGRIRIEADATNVIRIYVADLHD